MTAIENDEINEELDTVEEESTAEEELEEVTSIGELMMRAEYISGDLRDALLTRFKHAKKPWEKMTEAEQKEFVAATNSTAEYVVKEVVSLVASAGRCVTTGKLESITVKDGIKAVVKINQHDENRHQLMDSCGSLVHTVVADPEPFVGADSEPKIDPDQPNLIDDEEETEGDWTGENEAQTITKVDAKTGEVIEDDEDGIL